MNEAIRWLEEEFDQIWAQWGDITHYQGDPLSYTYYRAWARDMAGDIVPRGQGIFNFKDDQQWAEPMEMYYGLHAA